MVSSKLSALLVRHPPLGSGCEAESLTSWLLRLANGNGFRTYGELFAYERRRLSRTAALDVDPQRWNLLHSMHELSLLPEGLIARHTLDVELGALAVNADISNIRWTLTSHSVVQQDRMSRHAYCAQCLCEDSIPYWRLGWRLSTSTTCAKHGTLLLDACPECGKALCISPSRELALDRCHACLFNLRLARSPAPADNACAWRVIPPSELTAQDLPVSLSWPHLWWNGVRVLLSVFTQKTVRAKLSGLALPAPLGATLAGLPQGRRLDFDSLHVRTRHDLLHLIQIVTTNWPAPFLAHMSDAGVTAADFLTCEIEMPYWLARVVNCGLNRKRYQVTEAEVRSAQALLKSRSTNVSKLSVKRLLGVTEGVAIDRLQPKRARQLSDVELLRIAEQLDRDVLTAPSGRDVQASVLRDAACIAAAAWLRIPFREATSLELDAGQALLKAWRESATSHGARSRLANMFAGWMILYLEGTRPRFERFERPSPALFLSRFGIPTNGFGLASRFANLLRRCGIEDWQFGCRLLLTPYKRVKDDQPTSKL